MLEIIPDTAGYPGHDGNAGIRRLPTRRRRREAQAAPLPAMPSQLALCDAHDRPLGLRDRVRVGGPNRHHGMVEIMGFSIKDERSALHYGGGFPDTASFWCFCAECVKEG